MLNKIDFVAGNITELQKEINDCKAEIEYYARWRNDTNNPYRKYRYDLASYRLAYLEGDTTVVDYNNAVIHLEKQLEEEQANKVSEQTQRKEAYDRAMQYAKDMETLKNLKRRSLGFRGPNTLLTYLSVLL